MAARLRSSALAANAALLLVLLVAVAALGALPHAVVEAGDRGPLKLEGSGALRIEDSRGRRAVLQAAALAPGGTAVGTVTIGSKGGPGRLSLSVTDLSAQPGSGGDSLSHALKLTIRELPPGPHRVLYSGRVAGVPRLHLGLLAAKEKRRFRFVASLPRSLAAEGLMGARVRFDFRWRLQSAR